MRLVNNAVFLGVSEIAIVLDFYLGKLTLCFLTTRARLLDKAIKV